MKQKIRVLVAIFSPESPDSLLQQLEGFDVLPLLQEEAVDSFPAIKTLDLLLIQTSHSPEAAIAFAQGVKEYSDSSPVPILICADNKLIKQELIQIFSLDSTDVLYRPFSKILLHQKIHSLVQQRAVMDQVKGQLWELEQQVITLRKSTEQYREEIRKRSEDRKKLSKGYQIFTAVLSGIEENICVVNLQSEEVLFANQQLKTTLGFDPTGKVAQKSNVYLRNAPYLSYSQERLLNELGEPQSVICEDFFHEPTGKWYSIKNCAIRWINNEYVRLEITTDITAQKQNQLLLEQAKEEAIKANLLKDKFLSMVAHDIKSPFTTILATIRRVIKKEEKLSAIHQKLLTNSLDSGTHLLKMISELLKMGRFSSGAIIPELKTVEIFSLVNKFIFLVAEQAKKKGVTINNEIPQQTYLFVDSYLFGEVIINLLTNAIKFCGQGGEVRIYTPSTVKKLLVIQDNGVGITPEFLPDLFNCERRMTTLGTAGEVGTGLGLLYCHDIIHAHQGTLSIESVLGQGTTIYIQLPSKPIRILFVHESSLMDTKFHHYFEPLNIEFIEPATMKEAKDVLFQHPPDLAIFDVLSLRDESLQLLKKLKQTPTITKIPTIIMVGGQDRDFRKHAFQLGGDAFLHKPIEPQELLHCIQGLINLSTNS